MKKKFVLTYYIYIALLFLFVSPCFASGASEALRNLGERFYIEGNYADAAHEFHKAVLADPSDDLSSAYYNLSRRKLRNKQISKSLDYLESKMLPESINPAEISRNAGSYSGQSSLNNPAPSNPAGNKVIQQQESAIEKSLKLAENKPLSENPSYNSQQSKNSKLDLEGTKTETNGAGEGNIDVTGDYQTSLGIEHGDVYWKRANYDLNEENWRTESGSALNQHENTYDPAIYSRVHLNIDDKKEEGLGFHSDIDISPWSFIGKSNKVTVTGGGDTADVELKYWANSGYTVNQTVYTNVLGDSFSLPEMKLTGGRTLPASINSLWNTFSIPELDIHREFWPLRELWFDYNSGPVSLEVFPAALQSKAYTSDDIIGLSNHKIYWEESPWLDSWAPGHLNTGAVPQDFFKGYWDDSLSSLARDSSGTYLTNLRGIAFSFDSDSTSLDITFASPKTLWQDYEVFDTYSGVVRLKHLLFDNFQIGSTYTAKLGYNEDSFDASNQAVGVDFNYGITPKSKVSLEMAKSKSIQDKTSGYETDKRGNAAKLSYVFSSQEDIFDKSYFGIVPEKDSQTPFYRGVLEFAHMDKGFEAGLSNYTETRDDSYWSRHIHFRKPFDYYYAGLYGSSLGWYDIEPNAIGDGIDYGRDVIRLRYEFSNFLGSNLDGLFDVRNVHSTKGKFIENVTHLEAAYRVTDKLTAKVLGIHQKLPKTKAGLDPFLFSTVTGDYLENSSITDGKDPSLKTVSAGAEYEFSPKVSLDFIWEHTNDSTLSNDNFPRGLLNWTSMTTYNQDGYVFRKLSQGLNHGECFSLPPYSYFDIFRAGIHLKPLENLEMYLDWTKNENYWAQAIDDNVNHISLEAAYMPLDKLGFYLKYTYSKMNDYTELNDGQTTGKNSHHNFFAEMRYRPVEDSEFILQYGVGGITPISVSTGSPFGGGIPVLDTQQVVRAYYRRKF